MSRSTFLPDTAQLLDLLRRAGAQTAAQTRTAQAEAHAGRATRPSFAAVRPSSTMPPPTSFHSEPTAPQPSKVPSNPLPSNRVPGRSVPGRSVPGIPDLAGSVDVRARAGLDWLERAASSERVFIVDGEGLPIDARRTDDVFLACAASMAVARASLVRLGQRPIATMSVDIDSTRLLVVWAETASGLLAAGWVVPVGHDAVSNQLRDRIIQLLHAIAAGLLPPQPTK